MTGEPRLTVEIIPTSLHGRNPRTAMGRAMWERQRKLVCEAAGNRCEICRGSAGRHPVEIHERYEYDETSRPPCQKVVGLSPCAPTATLSSIWREHGWWPDSRAIHRSTRARFATSCASTIGMTSVCGTTSPRFRPSSASGKRSESGSRTSRPYSAPPPLERARKGRGLGPSLACPMAAPPTHARKSERDRPPALN